MAEPSFTGLTALESGSQEIQDMAEDSEGRIWAISLEYLFRFDDPNWTRVDISMAKLGHHLSDLAIDKSGGLWINGSGTRGSALPITKRPRRRLYDAAFVFERSRVFAGG